MPESASHLGVHFYDSRGVCVICGCTESAVQEFRWSCKPRDSQGDALPTLVLGLSITPPAREHYTIVGAPGVVRYLSCEQFFKGDCEAVIGAIRQLGASPEIQFPRWPEMMLPLDRQDSCALKFEDIEALLDGFSWEERLRVHHALGWLFLTEHMPPRVYRHFHVLLGLGRTFELEKCLQAWVKGTERNFDLALSYINSPGHVVTKPEGAFTDFYCVYRKTSFVRERLEAIARERAAEARKRADEAATARQIAEEAALEKSQFKTFVYLMEDQRNGRFKIGQSQTPGKRERTLQSEVPQIHLRLAIPADPLREKQLHEHFSAKRSRGEWFTLTAEDLLWVVSFLKTNGDSSRVIVDHEWLGKLHFRDSVVKAAPKTTGV